MEALLFTLGTGFLRIAYRIAAWVNPKARAFHEGRIRQREELLRSFPGNHAQPLVWFHCASLGEFEQGRPVMEALKAAHADVKLLVTFFSPSGYEVRKNYSLADYVFYLPWDTVSNANFFARQVKPALAVFVKYEFWYHYSRALRQHHIPLVSISAIFRASQIFFKPQGFPFRSILKNFSHFFVQNQASLLLLQTIGLQNGTVAGDTRFDRVAAVAAQSFENNVVRTFCGNAKVLVIGSAWPEDIAVLMPFMNSSRGQLKFIVAPHEVKEEFMQDIEKSFQGKSVRYSRFEDGNSDLLVVDTIGLLAQLYRYGAFAFVGGGYRQGLHNILEAACYGIPVFFGSTAPYNAYQEAIDLVAQAGAFAVGNTEELTTSYNQLTQTQQLYTKAAQTCRDYVQKNRGATERITAYLLKTLEQWKAA